MAGNIARRPNGKWRARYRDRSGREHARHFLDLMSARRWLDLATSPEHLGPITFAGFYGDWSQRQLWATGTATAMSLSARTASFRDRPITDVNRRDVEIWVKSMDSAGLAPGTVKTRFTNVRSVLRAAVREGMIAADPTDDIRLPRRRRTSAVISIPTPVHVGAMLECAPSGFRAFIGLCAFAGLRLGEAAGVQAADVVVEAAELRVARQVQRRSGGGYEVTLPKNQSERVVGLAPGIFDLLQPHLEAVGSSGDEWLFHRGGVPLHQGTAAYLWRKTLAAAGLSGIRLHDLRHFYASGLIASGCDVVTVQRALGHANANTTLGTYAHLWPSAEDSTRSAAESMLTASLEHDHGRGAESCRAEGFDHARR